MDLDLIDLAVVGEDHQIRVRRRDKQMFDKVFIFCRCAKPAFAAATLPRISRYRRSLDITGFCDGNRNVLVLDQIFDTEFDIRIYDDGPPLIAELLFDIRKLVRNYLPQDTLVRKDIFQLGYVLDDSFVLIENFLTLKS